MMTALLLYAYCQGVYSSRRIARGCEERMDFMAVTGLNRPDFRTVSDFVDGGPKMYQQSRLCVPAIIAQEGGRHGLKSRFGVP